MAKIKKMTGEGGGHDISIDMTPFINFLVVLIPVLMLSAEFAQIAIINMKLPEGRGSQTDKAVENPPLDDESDKLMLTEIITDSVVTIGAKGGFLPSLYYVEFHKYVAADDRRIEVTVQMDPKNPNKAVINPSTNKPFRLGERQEILLYVTDESHQKIIKCLYTKDNEMITDASGNPLEQANVGDSVFVLTNPRRLLVVRNASELELRSLSAYDQMKNRLMQIKDRYRDARDNEDIILAAENQVAYDKIIQLMDCARDAEFPNIQIAKLRG